jgi:hypothetical protein
MSKINMMSWAIRSAFLTFTGFSLLVSMTMVQAKGCIDHRELVEASDAELEDMQPCDFLGYTFVFGLGLNLDNMELPEKDSGYKIYEFYPPFRYYLRERKLSDTASSADDMGFLMGAFPFIDSTSEEIGFERASAYQVFIIGSYWDANPGRIDKSKSIVSGVMKTLLSVTRFKNFSDIKCFVISDIPTIPIDKIVKTSRFLQCREGE